MNGLNERIKSRGFWISLSSAVVVFIQCLGIKVNQPKVDMCITAFCAILFVLGIISEEKNIKVKRNLSDTKEDTIEKQQEDI